MQDIRDGTSAVPVRVLLYMQVPDIGRAMELGQQAAEEVSATFIKPIRLEFEKAHPLLTLSRPTN